YAGRKSGQRASAGSGQNKDALLGQQIGEVAARIEGKRAAMPVEGLATLDAGSDLVAQRNKVVDRAQMDVRRVVPVVVEQLGNRHPTAEEQSKTNPPEPKIGKRHDRPLADPQQFFEHMARLARRLQ